MPGRFYTSYDVYRDYNSDELLNDIYPGPIDGVYTPQPMDGRFTPQFEMMSPARPSHSRVASGRPKSRLRTPGRPPTRTEVGVQTEKRPKPVISETQYNYAIPDEGVRPTSPVQRLLDRWHTQPNMSVQGPAPGSQMDPITKQYYHRVWKSQAPSQSDVHLYRYGRAGGVWRHVRACVANTGTQMAFIDGIVKEEDNVFFPPWNQPPPSMQRRASYSAYSSAPNMPNKLTANFVPATQRVMPPKPTKYKNRFNNHAKEGFKYWYQEPKPIDSKRVELARRRIMMARASKPASMAV